MIKLSLSKGYMYHSIGTSQYHYLLQAGLSLHTMLT